MKRFAAIAVLIALLLSCVPACSTIAAIAPPAITESSVARFTVTKPPTPPFRFVQILIDINDGAGAVRHSHGGPAFIVLLEGGLTLVENDTPRTYKAGDSFTETPGNVYAAANSSGAKARLFVTYLVPVSLPITTVAASGATVGGTPPGPTTIFQAEAPAPPAAVSYDVIQSVRDYPPGAWTVAGADPGPTAAMVVEGEVTVNVNGQDTVFKAGQQWVEPTGVFSKSGTAGATRARVLVTKLVPAGAP